MSFDDEIHGKVVPVGLLLTMRWCTRERGWTEWLKSFGEGLEEVVLGQLLAMVGGKQGWCTGEELLRSFGEMLLGGLLLLLARVGRKVEPRMEGEGGIALLFGPNRKLRWVAVAQIRCLTRKDGEHGGGDLLVEKGACSPTSPSSPPPTSCLSYSTGRGRQGGRPRREESPTSSSQSRTFPLRGAVFCCSSRPRVVIKH